ncbi:NAD-dependent epimerase/dehydratase family protein [Patescibacteria group bacterium]|nr:NAD-dependent epimerase/dehydratase family protein [Patescibacteria group bacterium]
MTTKAKFKKKNILILGGAGFLGSHLCEELVKENQVICIDNFLSSSVENIRFLLQNPNFVFIKHNISEPLDFGKSPELAKFSVKVQGIQEVYNLACPTSVKNFDNYVIETILANSVGVKNVLDLVMKYDAEFLHLSSAVVYGPRREDNYFFKEDEWGSVKTLSPRACYDEGKRFAEAMINTYALYHKKKFKIARIFRTYGPRMMLNDGQMIPDFILNALDGRDLVIYGDKNLTTTLCYVDDIVQGLIKFMGSTLDGPLNLGSEEIVSLVDVAKEIIKLTNSSSKIVFKPPLLFMSPLGLPNIAKARNQLGWFPLINPTDGFKKTLEYTLAHKQLLDTQFNNTLDK